LDKARLHHYTCSISHSHIEEHTMRNIINTIKTGGPPAVLTLGGGAWVFRDELHYLLRPQVGETIAAAVAIGGAALWLKGKGKRKAAAAEQEQEQAAQSQPQAQPQALPPGQPTATEAQAYLTGVRDALYAKRDEPASQHRVIDLGHA